MVLRTGMPMKMLEQENEEYINDCDDILDEMPIRIGYDINIDWIKNIEECRLKNEIVVATKTKNFYFNSKNSLIFLLKSFIIINIKKGTKI